MKIALITGSNSGFGMLSALELARRNYIVIATMRDLHNQTDLMKRANSENIASRIICMKMNVSDVEGIKEVRTFIEKTYGKMDVIINNAGYCQAGFFEELTEREWMEQYSTNVFGTIHVTKYLLPLLRMNGGGKIINTSSVSGILGFPGMSPYVSSKFAIEGLSESLRLELMDEQIWVSLIQPASFQTKIWEKGLDKMVLNEGASIFQQNLFKAAHQSKENGADPITVATLIADICETAKPKFRYPVGKGASRLSFLKRIIPWSIIERTVHIKLARKKKNHK